MKSYIFLALIIFSMNSKAQEATEDAILLNQEMQFLEDSVKRVDPSPLQTSPRREVKTTKRGAAPESLEAMYFEETKEDKVMTRKAAPKRRY